jgi:histone acetyltransferase (RNA polymerase elongator complex component)
MTKFYIIPIFVPHKGCPHDCIFCNQKKITGLINEVTSQDVENTIEAYLKTINRKDSHIEISFFGGSFTGIPMDYQNELLNVAKAAKDKGLVNAIRLSTRPDYINIDILNNLKKYEVDVIELGVQSMDNEVLVVSERGHSSIDVENASILIKEYGFKLGLQMMIGLPKDNLEKDVATAQKIITLRPDFVRIYPTLVIRETYLEELYYKNEYCPLSIDEAIFICKKLYILFIKNDIQIIRLGLQPTEQISLNGDVICGPFHSAFRECVEGSIINDMADYIIKKYFFDSESLKIEISNKDISKLFTDKKRYFNELINKYESKSIQIFQESTMKRLELRLVNDKKEINMSLYEYIKLVM